MKILIAIPTQSEINYDTHNSLRQKFNFDLIILGIGIVNSTYVLTKYLQTNNVDFVIHGGIAGSFKPDLKIGSVVEVVEDIFADFGVNENDKIIHASDIFHEQRWFKNTLFNKINLPQVKGITVNSITANYNTKLLYENLYNADVETMENAAVFFVCQKFQVPFLAVRSISNFVGDRNKQNWNVELAVENLWLILKQIIGNIND